MYQKMPFEIFFEIWNLNNWHISLESQIKDGYLLKQDIIKMFILSKQKISSTV